MADRGKSLEGQFMALADDLAKEAGRLMEPESYGQWADETYRLMTEAAKTAGDASAGGANVPGMDAEAPSMPSLPDASKMSTASSTRAKSSGRTMADGVAMIKPAIKAAEQVIPAMEDVYATTANSAMDGYYFMAESASSFSPDDVASLAPGEPVPGNPVPEDPVPGNPVSGMGRIEGLDVLDPDFLCRMANDLFKSSAEYMPAMENMAKQTMSKYGKDEYAKRLGETPASPAAPTLTSPSSGASMPGLNDTAYFMRDMKSAPSTGGSASAFDVEGVRRDFPILQRKIHGKPLIWLDNGATTQKPQVVIDRVSHFYEHENSNVHRGAHTLAAESTDAYEGARSRVAAFLGGPLPEEVIFVRGTTEGINLVANICGDTFLGAGDEIVLTEAEHHANIVPWQFVSQRTGAKIRVAPIDDNGDIILEEYARLLGPRTKIVSMTHVSNALGTVMPINEMTAMAKRYGAIVMIDGAQGAPHRRVNVQEIGCDFYVFSGHKLFAPTGIGAVWGRKELWEEVSPWQGGGSMIEKVTFEKSTFADLPNKFEAGTGSLASAVGLGAAIDYVSSLGLDAIERHETDVVNYAVEEIRNIKGVRMIGMPHDRAGVVSFVMDGIPSSEVGTLLDGDGIAVRTGHHCAQPVLAHFGLDSTIRPAFAFYNTRAEVDTLVEALNRIRFDSQA